MNLKNIVTIICALYNSRTITLQQAMALLEKYISQMGNNSGSGTGTAGKMFSVAGPVIVFGTAASVVYGLVLYLLGWKKKEPPSRRFFLYFG